MKSTRVLGVVCGCAFISLAGCDRKSDPKPAPAPAADGHAHADEHAHGPTIQLGEQTVAGLTIKASRDGAISVGTDAPIDVSISGDAKIGAVRFWVGAQDAKGSVKARAEREGSGWHTHAEIPSPLPEGSRLWVEVETESGEKHLAGFDLRN